MKKLFILMGFPLLSRMDFPLEYLSKYWGFIKLQSEYQLRESFALVVFQLGEYT